jgi:hypothetical protein
MLWCALLVLGTAGTGWLVYLAARRPAGWATPLAAASLALLGLRVGLDLRPDWEWRVLPWAGYAPWQSLSLYAFGVCFFAAAAAHLPLRWNRQVLGLAAGLLLAHGAWQHAGLCWPETHGDLRRPGVDRHLRQSTVYTCGAAACASALAWFGRSHSERELAAACRTRRTGCRLWDLYAGLLRTAPDLPISIERFDPGQVAGELVLVGSNRSRGHAVAVALVGELAILHDPLQKAPRTLPRRLLADELAGPFVVLRGPLVAPPPAATPAAPLSSARPAAAPSPPAAAR